MILLVDEIVRARLRLEEQSIERPLGPIVRMQMELTVGNRGLRVESRKSRKGETAKSGGNESSRGALAKADEKVTATRT